MNYQNVVETIAQILNGTSEKKAEYMGDPVGFLSENGIVDSEEQNVINQLLIPVDDIRKRQMTTYKLQTDYQKKNAGALCTGK